MPERVNLEAISKMNKGRVLNETILQPFTRKEVFLFVNVKYRQAKLSTMY